MPLAFAPRTPFAGLNGRAHALVMDDDAVTLGDARAALEWLGCTVVPVRDGDAAVVEFRAARDRGRPFDVVFLDVSVPGGVGGEAALARLRALDPGVRVVLVGSFDGGAFAEHCRDYGVAAVLTRPLGIAGVVRALVAAGIPRTAAPAAGAA